MTVIEVKITPIIIHWNQYLFSDWAKAYSEFAESARRFAADYTIIISRTLKVPTNHADLITNKNHALHDF